MVEDITTAIYEKLKQAGWQGKIVSIEHVQELEKEIEARRHAELQAGSRLRRMETLHTIDLIINSSLDLKITLKCAKLQLFNTKFISVIYFKRIILIKSSINN